jgi:hypothetical protein
VPGKEYELKACQDTMIVPIAPAIMQSLEMSNSFFETTSPAQKFSLKQLQEGLPIRVMFLRYCKGQAYQNLSRISAIRGMGRRSPRCVEKMIDYFITRSSVSFGEPRSSEMCGLTRQ